ncbi:MAG TPA: MFS transporter [Pseudolysinimonas sp.]|nr:MFS transporter [Pseudolysinimonas sp.]
MADRRRLPPALRPFRIGQYRILTVALVLSMLGAGTWLVAVVFEVRALGGGPIELSFIATAAAVGILVAVVFGGVVADRVPQKRILVTVEATKTVTIVVIATLALTGNIEVWHLAVAGVVLGLADGFFYPAYSALLPSVLPADELLAANGIEGMLRPTIMQALGPVVAAAAVAVASPALAFAIVGVAQALAVAGLLFLRPTRVRRDFDEAEQQRHPVVGFVVDLREGVRYIAKTRWLLASLLSASVIVFFIMGPIEVLLPFAVTEQTGGGAAEFAFVLAAFGAGGAISSIVVASVRLPRRYLTVMLIAWGLASAPLAVIGVTDQLWVMALAVFTVGVGFGVAQVIWGTILQRRVPPALLGRISSLDFFTTLVFMPVSMALAGPIGEAIGFAPTFLLAGLAPPVVTVVVIFVARLGRDEIANPLRSDPVLGAS